MLCSRGREGINAIMDGKWESKEMKSYTFGQLLFSGVSALSHYGEPQDDAERCFGVFKLAWKSCGEFLSEIEYTTE